MKETVTAMQPVIICKEVDDENTWESDYRVRVGDQVKYLVIAGGTFDRDTMSFPLESLPEMPWDSDWTIANIARDELGADLKITYSNRTLEGVKNNWHPISVDCLKLRRTGWSHALTYVATLETAPPETELPAEFIAKIASFEFEIFRIEQETRIYQLLEGTGLAPRFLGHVHENGRIIGFMMEKIEGRHASIEDLGTCEAVLRKFHVRKILHGDANRYNFLIEKDGVKLIDFENSREDPTEESMSLEMASLHAQLVEETGRGTKQLWTD